MNLGIMYGMGVNKMAGVLDTTVEEAKELLNEYHEKFHLSEGWRTWCPTMRLRTGKLELF